MNETDTTLVIAGILITVAIGLIPLLARLRTNGTTMDDIYFAKFIAAWDEGDVEAKIFYDGHVIHVVGEELKLVTPGNLIWFRKINQYV